jgi:polysaccharide biosynthesis/export protein
MKRIDSVVAMIVILGGLAVAQDKAPASTAPVEGAQASAAPVMQAKASAAVPQTSAAEPGTYLIGQMDDPSTYVIGALDVLQISVWKEPEMSAPSIPVRPDGKISLPLLGDTQAAGLTPMQLSAALADQAKRYVQDPQVTVIVTAINSKRVYILGEVGHAGPLSLLPKMTVLQALASAGGLSQFANAKKIYLLRPVNGAQQRIPFNYKLALKGDPKQDFLLQQGDTIVVP